MRKRFLYLHVPLLQTPVAYLEDHLEVAVAAVEDLLHVSRFQISHAHLTYLPCPPAEGAEVVVEVGPACPRNAKMSSA